MAAHLWVCLSKSKSIGIGIGIGIGIEIEFYMRQFSQGHL